MQQDEDFGDFEEVKEDSPNENSESEIKIPTRVRQPRGIQKIGIILQRLGGNRMDIKSTDGKIRNCRVPGRYKRRLWLRPKDVVLIEPWPDNDEKGDVIYKYNSSEIIQLKKQKILANIETSF